jgi:hypothetical protein
MDGQRRDDGLADHSPRSGLSLPVPLSQLIWARVMRVDVDDHVLEPSSQITITMAVLQQGNMDDHHRLDAPEPVLNSITLSFNQ